MYTSSRIPVMTDSTYALTLVNDRDFYDLRYGTQCVTRALHLYNAYHSKDGLTVAEKLTTIAAVLDQYEV
jgi:hypothetical protein